MNPIIYIFLAFAAVLAATANAVGPVLDIDGDVLFGGMSYYVLPVIRGQGGGLTLAGRGDEPCPMDIVQESSEVDEGIPVKFSNWRPRVAFVPESQNLNIEMDVAATICVQSTYWWVGRYQNIVTAGPKPEQDSARSLFQIQKSEDGYYKFAICPVDPTDCGDAGIIVDEKGVRRLAITNDRFLFRFKKANVTEDSSKAMSM